MRDSVVLYKNRYEDRLIEEKVPGFFMIKFLYSKKYMKLFLKYMIANKFLSTLYGVYMKSFLSKRLIEPFVQMYNVNTQESEKGMSQFKNFNDFFIRKLKVNSRKIDNNDEVLISPCDGKILVYEHLNTSDTHFVKGINFNLLSLLQEKELVMSYNKYSISIIRLAPTDYHRFHFPLDGYVKETKLIPGLYYSVLPLALKYLHEIFIMNKRSICEILNDTIGTYLYIEVGATMVGSIRQTYKPFTKIKKGDEKGYFEFGGSTIILLFKDGSVKFDDDLLENSRNHVETKISMGESIGKIFEISGD